MKISTDGVTFALETESGNGYFYSREEAEDYMVLKYYGHLYDLNWEVKYDKDGETIASIYVKAQK